MQRQSTKEAHQEKINDALYKIHRDFGHPLHVKEIAAHVSTSVYHFNRLFYMYMGEHVHAYLRRIRLEHAANLLLFNPHRSVLNIAQEVGFASAASFTHAFKQHFMVAPTKWREVDQDNAPQSTQILPLEQSPHIVRTPARTLAYVRHKGYNKSIQMPWQKLLEWARQEGVPVTATMLGLHHSNPRFVAREACHYVACLEVSAPCFPKGEIGIMRMPSLLCAVFSFEGKYGDFLKQMESVYYDWLPNSTFERLHLPAFAIYHKNHFIAPDERYVLDFYIPVCYK